MAGGVINGTLVAEVIQARGLLALDRSGASDPFVALHFGQARLRTKVVSSSLAPKWDAKGELGPCANVTEIRVNVYDWNRFTGNKDMGALVIPVSQLADGVEHRAWFPLVAPSAAQPAGEIEISLTFRATVAPPEEPLVQLPVLADSERAPRTSADDGELFSGTFAAAVIQRLERSVDLPFLDKAQESQLYNVLLRTLSKLVPSTLIAYVLDKMHSIDLPDWKALFGDDVKARIVAALTGTFDIPFMSQSAERALYASAFIQLKYILSAEQALISWFLDGLRYLNEWRKTHGIQDAIDAVKAVVSSDDAGPAAP